MEVISGSKVNWDKNKIRMDEIDWWSCQGLIITTKYLFQGMRNTMMDKNRQLKSEIESVKFQFIEMELSQG